MAKAKIDRNKIELGDDELNILREIEDAEDALALASGEEIDDVDEEVEEDEDEEPEEDDHPDEDEEDLDDEDEESEDEEDDDEDEELESKLAAKAAASERRKFKRRMAKQKQEYEDRIAELEGKVQTGQSAEKIVRMLSKVTGKERDQLGEHIKNSQKATFIKNGMKPELAERYATDMLKEFSKEADKPAVQEQQKSKKSDEDLYDAAEALSRKKLYKGLGDHLEEVVEFAEKTGVDVKSAYHALYHEEYQKRYDRTKALEQKHKQKSKGTKKVGRSKGQRKVKVKERNLSADQIEMYQEMGLDLDEMEALNEAPDLYEYKKLQQSKDKKEE